MLVRTQILVLVAAIAAVVMDAHAQTPKTVVLVKDIRSGDIDNATVVFDREDDTRLVGRFDPVNHWYGFDTPFTRGTITVTHPDFEKQVVHLKETPTETAVTVYLGKPGSSYTYNGGRRVPYLLEPNVIGIIGTEANLPVIREALKGFDVQVKQAATYLIAVTRSRPFERAGEEILRRLRSLPEAYDSGLRVSLLAGGNTIQTHRIIIRFLPGTTEEQRNRLLAAEKLTRERAMGNDTYLVAADISMGDAINEILDRLLADKSVAEVNGEFIAWESPTERP